MGVGGIYGCGCKEVYILPHITYPYNYIPLVAICSFSQQHPHFCSFKKMSFIPLTAEIPEI